MNPLDGWRLTPTRTALLIFNCYPSFEKDVHMCCVYIRYFYLVYLTVYVASGLPFLDLFGVKTGKK